MYTYKTARYLALNTVYFAKLLRERFIPTNLNRLIEEARAESAGARPVRHGSTGGS